MELVKRLLSVEEKRGHENARAVVVVGESGLGGGGGLSCSLLLVNDEKRSNIQWSV